MKKLILILALAAASSNYAQIHIKDNQTFNLAVGNDGLEIETSRNLYVRASLCTNKIYGGIGLNISSDRFDTVITHVGARIGKKFGEPAGIFGLEAGADVKLNDAFFVGARVFSDWIANNKGNINDLGYGVRIGIFL